LILFRASRFDKYCPVCWVDEGALRQYTADLRFTLEYQRMLCLFGLALSPWSLIFFFSFVALGCVQNDSIALVANSIVHSSNATPFTIPDHLVFSRQKQSFPSECHWLTALALRIRIVSIAAAVRCRYSERWPIERLLPLLSCAFRKARSHSPSATEEESIGLLERKKPQSS
jgi:hypothetical protein